MHLHKINPGNPKDFYITVFYERGNIKMSDNDKNKNASVGTEESVDDILAGILNPDGTFNDEFNGLMARYVGGGQTTEQVPDVDLSDRRDEKYADKTDYNVGDISVPDRRSADERIADKMPEGVRDVYTDASSDARRPEFTSTGDVKYPTMGVGESEERVVYDADWEETAKKEAARLERVRQDRMLRGDSAYARTFVAGGMYMPRKNPYVDAPGANPLYIDPLSGDEDFEGADENSEFYNSNKKPFFPEGFSAAQKSNSVAGGKTEKHKSSRYVNTPTPSDSEWLKVDDKTNKKKKRRFGKKNEQPDISDNNNDKPAPVTPSETDDGDDSPVTVTHRVSPFAGESIEEVNSETRGLRSTVAQIVDKYNKRSEEEARKKQEEEAKKEELRRENELRERRRQEEIRRMKKDMSPELCQAIDSEEENTAFEEYDDFSTSPAEKEPDKETKAFGVVFDPAAISGEEFVERLDNDEPSQTPPEEKEKNENKPSEKKSKGKKKPDRKN